jgi:hypothetical protein
MQGGLNWAIASESPNHTVCIQEKSKKYFEVGAGE